MTNDIVITTKPGELVASDLAAAFDAFDQAAARFLATRKSQRTGQTYQVGLELYRDLALKAGTDPLRADALIVFNAALQGRRRDRGGDLANDTIRARMKAVQAFFSWAWGFNLTPLKPQQVSNFLNMPPARKLSPRDVLTVDEARRLITMALVDGGQETLCLVRVMLDGGLRISEALGLRCSDVYAAQGKYWLHVAHGKGDKEREVEIPHDLYRDLATYAAGLSLDLIDPRTTEEPLFNASRPTAWRHVKAAAEAAAIQKNVTPHTLRHTHAHHLRLSAWPLEAIGERLGHATLETTKIYTRPAELTMQIPLPAMPWADEEK